MGEEKFSKVFFLIALVGFMILTFFIIWPFFSYIVIGIILAASFRPLHRWFLRHVKNENVCAGIMVIIILLLIIIPTFLITTKLVTEAGKAYNALASEESLALASQSIQQHFGISVNLQTWASQLALGIQQKMVSMAPDVISSVTGILLGLFVMFFIMYYVFKQGEQILQEIKDFLPLKKKYLEKLWKEAEAVLQGVVYGQVLTAIIQGSLGGLLLFVFGVPNSLFWGFIMIILSFLPVLGTPLVWAPAGIYMIATGNTFAGIMILAIGVVIIMNIDNLIKPRLISHKSNIHPVIALIGVLGGVYIFGFVGILIGPLIMAMFLVLLKLYKEDFKPLLLGES